MTRAIREVYESFEAEGLAFIPLEALVPGPEDAEEEEEKKKDEETQGEVQEREPRPKMTREELTRATALKRDHLLLPEPLAAQACKLCTQLIAAFYSAEEDRNTALWQKFLFPTAGRALEHVKKEEFQLAFGELLGLLLFASQEASWVLDKQAAAEATRFCAFFGDLSAAWAAVLAREDADLGLAPEGGRQGGYRPRLLGLPKAWEQETNEYLRCLETPWGEADASSSACLLSSLPSPAAVRLLVVPVPLAEK